MLNIKMPLKTRLAFVVTLLCLIALAIVLTIYIAWLMYPLEIQWLGLESVVNMSQETIHHNFNILLNYLTNPFQKILEMPDFPSSPDGYYHFKVVKKLFHLAQVFFLISLPLALVFFKNKQVRQTKFLLSRGFALMVLTPLLVASFATMIGFSQFFVIFHQILFPGDSTWLFHPALDPVILILPEAYFLHCSILFLAVYELIAIGGYFWTKQKQQN